MKALSIRPDYAFDIFIGEKTKEFRSWQTTHRGNLLICSTNKKIPGTISGHALIVCDIISIDEISGGYSWNLGNFKTIHPFKVKGQQRLFEIDDNLIKFTNFEDSSMDSDTINKWIDKEILPLII